MTVLNVSNPTKHNQIIVYRLPESPQAVRRPLKPGEQIAIRDLTVMDAEAIIKQNVVYGWVDAAAVDRTKPFASIVYSVDKSITPNKIVATMEHNLDVLRARGQQNRELAAVATNNALERVFEASQVADLQSMSMSIEEEGTKSRDAEVAEHFTVDRHADAPRTQSHKPSQRQAGKARR